MSAVLKTRPHDALYAQTQFLKRPLHWGMWASINDLLWLDAAHRIPLARLRQLICATQPHRKAFEAVIAEHFSIDPEGFVHCPELTARHATDLTNYRQKVAAGRSGGIASVKARGLAPAAAQSKALNPAPQDF